MSMETGVAPEQTPDRTQVRRCKPKEPDLATVLHLDPLLWEMPLAFLPLNLRTAPHPGSEPAPGPYRCAIGPGQEDRPAHLAEELPLPREDSIQPAVSPGSWLQCSELTAVCLFIICLG